MSGFGIHAIDLLSITMTSGLILIQLFIKVNSEAIGRTNPLTPEGTHNHDVHPFLHPDPERS
ncbi:hypothetical protein [Streptomyces cupreus]|uniref:Uncharacterized protein n=1 Tax=Streptomyces cupreus TaxID=2759956 RepID=A0A7X1MAR7_9ACTN|nr:hypothetical protein [Streptomyces cupreus]MBC2904432.1 hypothetical protein [Streptomyces cupreus]